MGIPILGICYGCQLMAYTLGGTGHHLHHFGIRQDRDDL